MKRPPSPLANPLANNPLLTRADVERAMLALFEPLLPHFSPGGARVKLGSEGVLFGAQCEELEGFARPLFGLVPLAMGGGSFDHWPLFARGLAHGVDPEHDEFWGYPGSDQRMVEMAAIGFALAFLPEHLYDPLPPKARRNLAEWLGRINQHAPNDCNWQFFRVLVNLGLQEVGIPHDAGAVAESVRILETHFDTGGFYHDGQPERIDYYLPWAYHAYGLIYARSNHADPSIAGRYRERARQFAEAFQYRFDAHGRGIPFGRSLTYRFAQAAFWSALVFADEEVLPWGRVKGLLLRHLRYWSTLPISDRDGVLSLGYAYRNFAIVEPYSSAGSPYWCTKAFLALAAPPEHAFWQAEEETSDQFEGSLERVHEEPESGALFLRDGFQSIMLSTGQHELKWPGTAAKYGKFAYSSAFGFSVEPQATLPDQGVYDSMLALRETTGPWRARVTSSERVVENARVSSLWEPWPDVWIRTVLVAAQAPWHFRIHRIDTKRPLKASERGFAVGRGPREGSSTKSSLLDDATGLVATTELGVSAIFDLELTNSRQVRRRAGLLRPLPATNLIWPRTVLPCLDIVLEPGRHLLACAVYASEELRDDDATTLFGKMPPLPESFLDGLD